VIPDRVVEVLEGPAFVQVGTRDARLRPAHTYVVGAIAHADRTTVTFIVPEGRSARMLSDLQDNGRVALTMSLASHESYQMKGTYLSSRPTGDQDVELQEAYRAKLYAAARQAGFPEEIARPLTLGFTYRPGVAITFRVEEIFRQTPGPGAGDRMV
jgi:hypothetical protein